MSTLRTDRIEDREGNPLWDAEQGILGEVTTSTGTQTVVEALDSRLAAYDIRRFGGVENTDITVAMRDAVNHVSAAGGGEIYIPFDCKLRGPITLSSNVRIKVQSDATIDCTEQLSGFYTLGAVGNLGEEIPLGQNATSGESTITTASPHNLNPGDWVLIKSQRACAVPEDAGDWTLGETTAGVSSPFFAEPKQVLKVDNPTLFSISTDLLFPDYLTDNSNESYASSRPSSTVQKINFIDDVSIKGGKWLAANGITLIRFILCNNPATDISVKLQNDPASAIFAQSCLNGNFKGRAERDSGWEVISDHSGYNTFKEAGCWNCTWDLVDIRGCQGWDQTYFGGQHPSLYSKVNILALGNLEQGATTHGNCYGANINVEAVNPGISGYLGRSPFSSVRVVMDGPGQSRVISGMTLSTYGVRSCMYSGVIRNADYGVDIVPSGVSLPTPARFSSIINDLRMENLRVHGINLRDREDSNTIASEFTITNVTTINCRRLAYIGAYNHGVHINGAYIAGGPLSSGFGHIEYQANSMGNSLANVRSSNFATEESSLIYTRSNNDPDLLNLYALGLDVDWSTVKHSGRGSLGRVIGFNRTTNRILSVLSHTVVSADSSEHIFINTSGEATLIVTDAIPIGSHVVVTMYGSGSISILAGSGITNIRSASGLKLTGDGATARLTRTAGSTYVASGDLTP